MKKVEQKLLSRKVPKVVSKVLNKFPNIGRDMELMHGEEQVC
jgi:hypothetical protein